ncbi:MAG TPA: response regulator transcription factor [Acidimicrobiia bacterium]|nr:response regulator transcription factor [Acidimicrobiia bacterium]
MARRIFLVDDHDVVRAGIKAVLDREYDIVGEAGDVARAVVGILETRPELVVLDVNLPGGGGSAVIERVRGIRPDIKFMALTVSSSRDDVVTMMHAGVDGYVTKTTLTDELPNLIELTAEGQRPVSPDVAAFLLDIDEDIDASTPIERLTPREREVVNLIARGYSYRETANRLSISVKTLESHMGHIFEKLSVASRHELAALAYEEGYVEGPGG